MVATVSGVALKLYSLTHCYMSLLRFLCLCDLHKMWPTGSFSIQHLPQEIPCGCFKIGKQYDVNKCKARSQLSIIYTFKPGIYRIKLCCILCIISNNNKNGTNSVHKRISWRSLTLCVYNSLHGELTDCIYQTATCYNTFSIRHFFRYFNTSH